MVSRIPEGYRAYDTLRGLSVSGVSAVIVTQNLGQTLVCFFFVLATVP